MAWSPFDSGLLKARSWRSALNNTRAHETQGTHKADVWGPRALSANHNRLKAIGTTARWDHSQHKRDRGFLWHFLNEVNWQARSVLYKCHEYRNFITVVRAELEQADGKHAGNGCLNTSSIVSESQQTEGYWYQPSSGEYCAISSASACLGIGILRSAARYSHVTQKRLPVYMSPRAYAVFTAWSECTRKHFYFNMPFTTFKLFPEVQWYHSMNSPAMLVAHFCYTACLPILFYMTKALRMSLRHHILL